MDELISDKQIEASIQNILDEFSRKAEQFHIFKESVYKLLHDILTDTDIKIMIIKKRVKEKDSIKDKIINKAKKNKDAKLYSNLSDIHDIVGLRIVVYLENDIDRVTQTIKNEFKVDKENSIDKRQHEYDRFGYLSNHLVLEIDDNRVKQTEYKKFKNIKFELQIRSGLQDVWAEIEHKLGYKSKSTLPYSKKRMLSRFAANLELIDKGFIDLKENNEQIISHNYLFEIIRSNKTILNIDHLIRGRLYYSEDDRWTFDEILKHLNLLNISTIDQIQQELEYKEKKLILFIEQVLDKAIPIQFTNGATLIYLCQYIAIEKFSKEQFMEYVDSAEMRYGKQAELYYDRLLLCYKRANFIYEFDLKERI